MAQSTKPSAATTRTESAGRPVLLVFGALLIGLVLSVTALIGVSAQRSSASVIDSLWAESSNQLLARVVLHVESIFQPAERFGTYSEKAVAAGRLDPLDTAALNDHLEAAIDAFPTIVWASFGTADGQYLSVYRWPRGDGTWEIRRTHRSVVVPGEKTRFREYLRVPGGAWKLIRDDTDGFYDPRLKPWWKVSAEGGAEEDHWTGPLLFYSRKQVGVMYSRPEHDPATGEFTGVWAAEFESAPVVDYLGDLDVGKGTGVYVLDEGGTIIARPSGPLVSEQGLLTAKSAGDPLLASVWQGMQKEAVAEGEPFPVDGHVAMYRGMPEASGLPWRVVVAVPTDALFAESREQTTFAAIVGVVGAVLSLLMTIAAAIILNRFVRSRVEEAVAASKVGQYTLEAKLGEGGMGEVYIAKHSMLRRPTAVKLLQPSFTNPIDIQRFEREVQMTCRLSHPNTITIFDYGETPDGRFYYAMEFIDGATLLDLVQFAGPLPPGRVIFIARQVCAALAEAHAVGLVHRDIKPANILVAELGGRGDFVKVVDFGLVKDVDEKDGITQDGSFAGTPGFLAPEVPMSPQMVGPVTDIYSVGAVMYVMLTAELPYEGDSGMAVFMKQQTDPPPPPSQRSSQAIPEDLERLVLRCMSRQPLQRPQSAEEVLQALRDCTDGDAWSEDDARRWWEVNGEKLRLMVRENRQATEHTTLLADTRVSDVGKPASSDQSS